MTICVVLSQQNLIQNTREYPKSQLELQHFWAADWRNDSVLLHNVKFLPALSNLAPCAVRAYENAEECFSIQWQTAQPRSSSSLNIPVCVFSRCACDAIAMKVGLFVFLMRRPGLIGERCTPPLPPTPSLPLTLLPLSSAIDQQ